ncbi:HAMP domain-containing sensor histidine kinase [Bacillus sp. 165]|uniref:sensor histidine kinase n=1 Tax=Bacillus sp. 165 TaxID=1529117 RepID=UPI001ADADE13|nr:HAMP domain-containing sensor histidine kinase [Bacillus sp. 165]MBO9128472.1 HAMP domain-containing protein [Bacillus sp. 165]
MRFTMVQKLWMTIIVVVIITLALFHFVSLYSYEKLYVQNVEETLKKEGKRLVSEYKGGPISDEFKKKVAWYNDISQAEILFVNNPRDLSACLPFDVHHESLISEKDRQMLLDGNTVTKVGYEDRFKRNIMGVVIPVLDGKKLNGIIYSYIPLKNIRDIIYDAALLLAPVALFVIAVTVFIGKKIVVTITKPILQMERVSYKMSKGNFNERIAVTSNDEVGRLGMAFNDMAQALQKEDIQRKEFLANVSHELRTPLSYIKGYSEAILDGVVKLEQQTKFIMLINKEAGRMQRLVHDLLDLAQLEGALFPIKKHPTVFAQLIEDVLEAYEPVSAEKSIMLQHELDPDIIANIDEDRIQQVLHNLLDNAIRYTPEGGVISIMLKQVGGKCILRISDTGVGIPKEHLDKLGERFYRVDKARSRQSGGTGLGLAIVKQIVEVHEGTIEFMSEVGEGTVISIEFPVVEE